MSREPSEALREHEASESLSPRDFADFSCLVRSWGCMGGMYGGGVWWGCMVGEYGGCVWWGCLVGVYGGGVWWVCMVGVSGGGVWCVWGARGLVGYYG